VTEQYDTEHHVTSDILINAAGHLQAFEYLQFPKSLQGDEQTGTQLLIDLMDDFDERALDYTEQRVCGYRGLGWQVNEHRTADTLV
jgi:hypothetical protein